MRARVVALWVGLVGLVLKAPAAGPEWTKTSGPTDGRVTALVVSGPYLFAGTEKGGVWIGLDGGDSWSACREGLPNNAVINCFVSGPAGLFAGTSKGVFMTTDSGASWTGRNTGLPGEFDVDALARVGTDLFAGGSEGFFKSADNGASWEPVNSGLPAEKYVVGFAALEKRLILAVSGAAFRLGDAGAGWTKIDAKFPPEAEILCLFSNGSDVFAGTVYASVLRLAREGKKWSPSNAGIPETEIHCFAATATDLFAGTGGGLDVMIEPGGGMTRIVHGAGVFRSTDGGKKWSAINSGLPHVATAFGKKVGTYIECLAASETYLFAATSEGVVWRLPLADLPRARRP